MKQNEEPEGIKPQMPKRVKRYLRRKSKANLDLIKKMENYCNDCVKWEEANVILGMMGDLFGFSSPPIKAAVARIKSNFNDKLYGKSINAKTVVMRKPRIEAMNKITGNTNVNLTKEYEEEKD